MYGIQIVYNTGQLRRAAFAGRSQTDKRSLTLQVTLPTLGTVAVTPTRYNKNNYFSYSCLTVLQMHGLTYTVTNPLQ